MNHRLTENVKLLQKIALFHEGKVLLLRRSPNEIPRPGCWDLPGGNSEWPTTWKPGDSETGLHVEDAVREVEEETTIQLQIENFTLQNLSYLETHFDSEKQLYSICFGWKFELSEKPEVTLSHEHTEFAWVTLDELNTYDFGDVGQWIKDVIR